MQQDQDAEASGDLLEKAYVYSTEGRYMDSCTGNDKRTIRQKPAKFAMHNGELLYEKSVSGLDGKKVEQAYIQLHSLFIEITSSTTDRCADPVHQNQGGADANPACMSL